MSTYIPDLNICILRFHHLNVDEAKLYINFYKEKILGKYMILNWDKYSDVSTLKYVFEYILKNKEELFKEIYEQDNKLPENKKKIPEKEIFEKKKENLEKKKENPEKENFEKEKEILEKEFLEKEKKILEKETLEKKNEIPEKKKEINLPFFVYFSQCKLENAKFVYEFIHKYFPGYFKKNIKYLTEYLHIFLDMHLENHKDFCNFIYSFSKQVCCKMIFLDKKYKEKITRVCLDVGL